MLVKTANNQIDQYPYTFGKLRRDNPNTSFPKLANDELLAEWNVFRVLKADKPVPSPAQKVVEGTPILTNGAWMQVWEIKDATAEEIAARTEAKSKEVRFNRDLLLSNSDWRVIKAQETNVSMDQTWVGCRQALRGMSYPP
jgi:hypothetical protein